MGSGTRLAVILWDALSSLSVFFATSREKKKRILTQRRKDAKKSKTIKQKIFENLGRASNNPDHALEFFRIARVRFSEYYHGTHGTTQNNTEQETTFTYSFRAVRVIRGKNLYLLRCYFSNAESGLSKQSLKTWDAHSLACKIFRRAASYSR